MHDTCIDDRIRPVITACALPCLKDGPGARREGSDSQFQLLMAQWSSGHAHRTQQSFKLVQACI